VKRGLPTTITPNRKPGPKVSRQEVRASKQLFSEQNDLPEASGCASLDGETESLQLRDSENSEAIQENSGAESNCTVEDEIKRLQNILAEAESLQKDVDTFEDRIKNVFNIETLKIDKKAKSV